MASLPNHFRAHRRRLGLSQEDVAYLLGVECGANVCRHERFVRDPNLDAALTYEAIYQKPAADLLAGHYQRIEREVAARARKLLAKAKQRKPDRHSDKRCQTLEALANRQSKKKKT